MGGVRCGVMHQAGQRVIDALCREGGQRARPVGVGLAGAVDDVVIRGGKVRHVEDVAEREFQHAFLRDRYLGVSGHGKMHGDGRVRRADDDGLAVVADEEVELLGQVVGKEVGAGDGGGIGARPGDMAEGEAGVGLDVRGRGQADFGIEGADAGLRFVAGDGGGEVLRQEARGGKVKLFQPGDGGGGVREGLGRGGGWGQDGKGFVVHSFLSCFFLAGLIRHLIRKRGARASDGFATPCGCGAGGPWSAA